MINPAVNKNIDTANSRAMEAKRQIANNAAIGGLSLLIISVLGGGMYLISLGIS